MSITMRASRERYTNPRRSSKGSCSLFSAYVCTLALRVVYSWHDWSSEWLYAARGCHHRLCSCQGQSTTTPLISGTHSPRQYGIFWCVYLIYLGYSQVLIPCKRPQLPFHPYPPRQETRPTLQSSRRPRIPFHPALKHLQSPRTGGFEQTPNIVASKSSCLRAAVRRSLFLFSTLP